jgi:hypothetical protein
MMRSPQIAWTVFLSTLAICICLANRVPSFAADHNDPNSINSIFSDIDVSAADLYDLFGFPSDDTTGGEKVVVALTFASIPKTGVFDTDMLYRIRFNPNPRISGGTEQTWEAMVKHYEALKDKYLRQAPAEVRVVVDKEGRAHIDFIMFPGGTFSKVIETNKTVTIEGPEKHSIQVYIGGRDDAFFNDLPGFFRSINYAPQFYHIPLAKKDTLGELEIPKTLLELEGNDLFNFDPKEPLLGQGKKIDLPQGHSLTWKGDKYKKDANGNFRFVYSGKDAQAGKNVNAIILEIPLAFLTKSPDQDRIVNVWGESWVSKASHKIATIPDVPEPSSELAAWLMYRWVVTGVVLAAGVFLLVRGIMAKRAGTPGWGSHVRVFVGIVLLVLGALFGVVTSFLAGPGEAPQPKQFADQLAQYKRVDTDGQPFADAALNKREDRLQVGANNITFAPRFVTRLGHLGWGFGPSISALGLKTAFDHDNSPISIHKVYPDSIAGVVEAFPRVKKILFQELNMPDNSWNKKGLPIPLRRPFEIFIPNVCAIDMDTTGSWPFGRRLEDQVATRFLSMFLDMTAEFDGKKYHVELLSNQGLWDKAPIEPKTPPNPLKNDKPFLDKFPYLAEPWPS